VIVNGADDNTEMDDGGALDAALSKALDGYSEPVSAAVKVDEAAPVDDTPKIEAKATGTDRDELGRFKPKAQAEGGITPAAEAAPKEPATQPNANPETTAAPAQAQAWTDGHFAGWKPEQRQRFNSLSPDVQALVMERQAEQQAFYQRKLTEEGEFRKQTEPLYQAAQKWSQFTQSIGKSPDELFEGYASIEATLRYAPYAEKVKLFADIAQAYGIPFAQPEPDPYADPLQPTGQAYPVIHDLQAQLQQERQRAQRLEQQYHSTVEQQLASQVQAFATEKNPDGSAKYPFFETVKPTMGQLLSTGQAKTLAEAYALASKPLEDQLQAAIAAKAATAQQQQAEIVAKAKKAQPIHSTGAIVNGRAAKTNLDDVISGAIGARFG